jgi:hypothetical protein
LQSGHNVFAANTQRSPPLNKPAPAWELHRRVESSRDRGQPKKLAAALQALND